MMGIDEIAQKWVEQFHERILNLIKEHTEKNHRPPKEIMVVYNPEGFMVAIAGSLNGYLFGIRMNPVANPFVGHSQILMTAIEDDRAQIIIDEEDMKIETQQIKAYSGVVPFPGKHEG